MSSVSNWHSPKTRSGKIMRRVLAAISNNEGAGDISTLANPEVVDYIERRGPSGKSSTLAPYAARRSDRSFCS